VPAAAARARAPRATSASLAGSSRPVSSVSVEVPTLTTRRLRVRSRTGMRTMLRPAWQAGRRARVLDSRAKTDRRWSAVKVAIVGATGAVGTEFLTLLEERSFPVISLRAFASPRSAGRTVSYAGQEVVVEPLPEDGNLGANVVFSSAGGSVSLAGAWRWVEHGAAVVDNTSAWRMDERVPLVVPEVNPEALEGHQGVIANPNCSTIIALMALAPLHRAFGLKRAVVATYQAVSGAGLWGIEELRRQTAAALAGEPVQPEKFKHQIAFNVFSHDSAVGEDGYNAEERKLLLESRKILGLP